MLFKGRTVMAFVLLACVAGSILTLTIAGVLDGSVLSGTARVSAVQSVLAANNGEVLSSEETAKLSAILKMVEERYVEDVDRQTLTDGALSGILAALEDPYSEYLDKKEVQSFSSHINSSFTGIGAEVTMRDGNVVVVSPIKNSPAERAGILAGDLILSVNGTPLQGLQLTEAVEKIRGPKGTQAKVRIVRQGSAEPMDMIVVRDDISLETVESRMLKDGIGYIDIRQFAVNTDKRFVEELSSLEKNRLTGLIIDVRNNPGGVVQAVQHISEQFVPKGKTIMHLEYRDGKREKTASQGHAKPYPVVVLVNQGSASASEILAAAIQESAGGTLVGKKTFGKGLVQSTVQLNDGTGVKLTIAKWLTPDGGTINKEGVTPDVEVEQPALFETIAISKERDLAFDMAGDEVKNVQHILEGLGYNPGRNDGYFNEATREAVRRFQRDAALAATGVVDEGTAQKLEEAVIQEYLDPKNDEQLKAAVAHLQKMPVR